MEARGSRKTTKDLARQTQRFLEEDESGISGDCWRTALAVLLREPWYQVPHFVYLDEAEILPEYYWWDRSVSWVNSKLPKWTLVMLDVTFPVYVDPYNSPSEVILTGKSPRGDFDHAVIANAITGEVIWDPHPSRAGLLETTSVFALSRIEPEEKAVAA